MRTFLRDIVIVFAFIILDIFSFYYWGKYVNIFFKPFFAAYLAWWFYQYASKPLSRKNKLLIISLGVMLIGELLFVFKENEMVNVVIILVYLIEHQMYISIFREENARLNNLLSQKKIVLFIPFLLTCFFFFGYQMMPNIPDNFLLMSIVYCVQLSLMAGLAIAREVNRKSYVMVIASISILLLSDAITSYSLFVSSFYLDYLIVRILFPISKVLFVVGMFYTLAINRLDKEYK